MRHYTQVAEAISLGGRKNRALAIGECCLKAMEMLEKENFKHHFLPGTLSWIIGEDKAVDPDGKKGYKYTVAYHVLADEKALTEEEITKEMDETREKVMAETREMFADVIERKEAEVKLAEGMNPEPDQQPVPPIPEGMAAEAVKLTGPIRIDEEDKGDMADMVVHMFGQDQAAE